MNGTLDAWASDAKRWLAQRSGSSKQHRDELPSTAVLDNIRRSMLLEAQKYLEASINLTTLIRLEQGK